MYVLHSMASTADLKCAACTVKLEFLCFHLEMIWVLNAHQSVCVCVNQANESDPVSDVLVGSAVPFLSLVWAAR